ncbi:HEAT repeat domain-containing protein [Archaeoglobus veneficus]|uniref:HEAT repeat domain-containing protein n=1 Tax=Archaeoglobus veneficus (strain DSM 11195 / SNP6) TaxID=693661 RepID=F2KPC0_ARCVS|nr:HEAT repeat domain-containing protein [Archaeoglobus veneficus]AEA47524.1 hypothetical protein Arcve_1522 [Archaeoglobus veneficus SNP6]
MTTYFCPKCWSEFKEDFRKCPVCGYDITEYKKLPYEDRLIISLGHPVREVRMNTIRLLGHMKSEKVLPHFEKMADTEDVFILMAIVDSLAIIRSRRAIELLSRLAEHNSKIVSQAAKKVLENLEP